MARNGRDWHHLIDLCALVGTLVIDPDGVYEPRLINDRLLLGLKGTMSEYELNLLRQRGLAARDSKAARGELRFGLPPGYCWDELGRIEVDPDGRVADAVRLVFTKFQELGSARQVFLWANDAERALARDATGAAWRTLGVAESGVPQHSDDPTEPDLCGSVRVRTHREPNPRRRGASTQDDGSSQAT